MASLTNYTPGGSLAGTDFWRAAMSGQLQPMPGNPNEFIDPATGYSFVPKYKEFEGDHGATVRNFDGGTLYQIQGKGDYTTPGYVYDAQGNPTDPGFQIEHKAPGFMDNYGWMVPLALAGGAAAMGLGAGSGAGAAAGAEGAVGSGAGFVGEGAASGIPAWDAAAGGSMSTAAGFTPTAWTASGAPVWGVVDPAFTGATLPATSMGTGALNFGASVAGGAAGAAAGSGGAGVPPPANPFATGAGTAAGAGSSLLSGAPSWLGPAATVAGGLLGSQGSNNSATSNRELPAYLQAPVTDLVGRTQGLLDSQMGPAGTAGSQMVTQGTGLMGAQVAGNGVGKVTLNSPNTPTNPYLSGLADDISRRTQRMLGQNNLSIAGRANMSAGTGSTRQGVAQGVAAGQASDYLSGNLASLYGTAYNNDQNRALQQYGMDQGFYTGQRGQDLAQVGVGSGLVNQGFQTQFQPLTQASQVYSPFSGMGSTTTSQNVGGGIGGALGGALGMAQLGKNAGWWG